MHVAYGLPDMFAEVVMNGTSSLSIIFVNVCLGILVPIVLFERFVSLQTACLFFSLKIKVYFPGSFFKYCSLFCVTQFCFIQLLLAITEKGFLDCFSLRNFLTDLLFVASHPIP